MKAIIFLAVLALTAFANTDYHLFRLGFNDQFSFTKEQRALNRKCFEALTTAEKDVRDAINAVIGDKKSVTDFLVVGAKALTDLKGVASKECLTAVTEIAKIGRTRNTRDSKIPFRAIARRNYQAYTEELIQQAALFAQNLWADNRDSQAGEAAGRFIKILFGIEQPKVRGTADIRSIKRAAPKDLAKSSLAFSQSFLAGIGINNEATTKRFAKSVADIYNLEAKLPQYYNRLVASKNGDEKLKVITEAGRELVAAYGNSAVDFELLNSVIARYRKNPITFVMNVVRSIALSAPEVEQLYTNFIAKVLQGKGGDAGQDAAKLAKILYRKF